MEIIITFAGILKFNIYHYSITISILSLLGNMDYKMNTIALHPSFRRVLHTDMKKLLVEWVMKFRRSYDLYP